MQRRASAVIIISSTSGRRKIENQFLCFDGGLTSQQSAKVNSGTGLLPQSDVLPTRGKRLKIKFSSQSILTLVLALTAVPQH